MDETVDAASCIGFVDLEFINREEQLVVSQDLERLIMIEVD